MDDQFKRPINAKKRVLEPTATNTKRIKVDRHDKTDKERQFEDDYIKKWTRAFRNIVLYFDKPPENNIKEEIIQLSVKLGASVEDFFSKKVTHVITSRDIPKVPVSVKSPPRDKENKPRLLSRQATPTYGDEAVTGTSTYTMMDPHSQKTQSIVDTQPKNPFLGPMHQRDDLLLRAQEFKIKVWSYTKIYNILNHLLANSDKHRLVRYDDEKSVKEREQSLKAMLKREKLQGTTERDRSVRTHDYYYFSRSIKYILVEDAKHIHRPVLIQEYATPRASEEPSWPILFACRDERNPFAKYYQNEAPFDGRVFASKSWGMQEHINYVVEAQLARLCKQGVITMVHVQHGEHGEHELMEDSDERREQGDDAYVAASGNSVTITSTNATSQAAHAHMAQRDKRVLQLNKRTTEHRPKTAHPRASVEFMPSKRDSDVARLGKESEVAHDSALASTSRRVSDTPAHTSFEQMLQHRRSSKGKPVVEEGAKPTNAAQALLRAREHTSQIPPDPTFRRRSNEKFEESVAALKNRGTERRVSGSKDESVKEGIKDGVKDGTEESSKENVSGRPTENTSPPKEILATKEARAAFKEVLPTKNMPMTKTPKPETQGEHSQPTQNIQPAEARHGPLTPLQTQQKEIAPSKEVDVEVSQETIELYNHVEKLQAKQKHKEKLSRRHENLKPGYCEICRVKFEDFDRHIKTSTHQRKATDPKIWRTLDSLLVQTARPLAKELPSIPAPTPPSPPKKVNMLKRLEKENSITNEELQGMILDPHVPVNMESTYIQNSQPTTVATTQTASASQPQSQSQSQSQSSKKSTENAVSQKGTNYFGDMVDLSVKKDVEYGSQQQGEQEQADGSVMDNLNYMQEYNEQQERPGDIQQPDKLDMYNKRSKYEQVESFKRNAGYYGNYHHGFSADQYQLQQQIADYDVEAEWNAIQDIINPPTTNNTHELEVPRAISHESITREDILSLIDDDGRAVQVYDDGDGYIEEDQLVDDYNVERYREKSPEMVEAPRSFSVFEPPQQGMHFRQLPRSGGNMDLVNTLTEVFRQMSDSNDHQQQHLHSQHSQSHHQSSSHSLIEQPLY